MRHLIALITTCIWVFLAVSCREKQQLFSKMEYSDTHINFENRIVESDSFNVFTYEYIYNGGGVGVGDINNDGLADLFFAGNMITSKLYLNKGGFNFTDITTTAGTTTNRWCTGVAMVDINQDGWLDIYISTAFTNRLGVAPNLLFLNKGLNKEGIPVFEEMAAAIGLDDSAYASQAAFLDYDLDGDLDMYLCNNSLKEADRNELIGQRKNGSGPSQDHLYRNEGKDSVSGLPRFKNVSQEASIQTEGWGLGIIVKDFNRDGWPDIYVANDFQSNDHLYINNQNGTFTNRVGEYFAHQSHNSMGADMADFNNDGWEDLCVVDMLPDDNKRQKTMFGSIPNDKYERALSLGYQPQFVRNVLQLNNGKLPDTSGAVSFSDIAYLSGMAATDWSWSPLWADFDMDGWRDLLITNGYVKDITDLDFMTYASEYKMFGSNATKMQQLREKAREIGEVKKANFLFKNNANLTFTDKAIDWGLSQPSFTNGTAYADFDNDGDLDIVMNNLNDKAFLYRNNSISFSGNNNNAPSFLKVKLAGSKGNIEGLGTTVTIWCNGTMQFTEHTLQRGYLSTVENIIHFGLGQTKFIDSIKINWPSRKIQLLKNIPANQTIIVKEADAISIDKDNTTRIHEPLLVNTSIIPGLDFIHEENEYIDFNYQYTLPHRYSIQGPALAVADVNGDGREDFYVGGASRHTGYFFIQQKKGFVSTPLLNSPQSKLQEETGSLLFDADGDGDNDLYCVAGGNEFGDSTAYKDLLFLNDGKGVFTEAAANVLPNTAASGSCVVAADYDRDGDIDLFIGGRNKPHQYPQTSRSYILRNDTDSIMKRVRFTDVTISLSSDLTTPGMVTAALWTDYNNDNWMDLMLVGEFMPIQLFKNVKGQRFEKLTIDAFKNSNRRRL
jgi:enediyne biosynthesis protein E4